MNAKYRDLGISDARAWVAGWDSSISDPEMASNPYKRDDFRRAWRRGREAGFRQDDNDVRILHLKVGALQRTGVAS